MSQPWNTTERTAETITTGLIPSLRAQKLRPALNQPELGDRVGFDTEGIIGKADRYPIRRLQWRIKALMGRWLRTAVHKAVSTHYMRVIGIGL